MTMMVTTMTTVMTITNTTTVMIIITILITVTTTTTIMGMTVNILTAIRTRTFRRPSRITRTAPASAIRSGCEDELLHSLVMVGLGPTIHESRGATAYDGIQTRGWSCQARP